jgi:antitoxin ParD1/3/4
MSKFDIMVPSMELAMTGRNFSLTDRLSAFVDDQVRDGRHQNASEVVREALRRYEDDIVAEAAALAAIEQIVERGRGEMARGAFTHIGSPKDAKALMDRVSARVEQSIAGPRRRD